MSAIESESPINVCQTKPLITYDCVFVYLYTLHNIFYAQTIFRVSLLYTHKVRRPSVQVYIVAMCRAQRRDGVR